MDILKIVAVGISGAVFAVALRKASPEISVLLGIFTGVIIFLFAIERIGELTGILGSIVRISGIDTGYITIILKITGIAYIAKFGSEICSDAGEKAIASKIEFAGKVLILTASAPVLLSLLEVIAGISI